MTYILGIESSCDETAAAVVQDGRTLLSNVVASQAALHAKYGGVFPEMASRQHMFAITPVIREALDQAELDWDDLEAIAVAHGPGLAGSLLVGVNAAKALSWARGLPLVGVNHMEAHLYANWLVPPGGNAETFRAPSFPLICLVVSGGHSDLFLVRDHHDYERLGGTLDDAAGEAFDKVARLLNLGYPGGPAIQRASTHGDPTAFAFPRAINVGSFDFSFSGLKTAVLRLIQELQREQGSAVEARGQKLAQAGLTATEAEEPEFVIPVADIAASFQAALVDALVTKTAEAVDQHHAAQVLLAGGVAANQLLRQEITRRLEIPVRYPPIAYCTDNAAMIAAAGYYRYLSGMRSRLDLDVIPDLALVR